MRSSIAAISVAFAQAFKYEYLQGHLMSDKTLSPIEVTIDGVKHTKYIVSESCSSNGADFTCPENSRGFIHNSSTFDSSKPDYWTPALVNKTIEWDVELGDFGIGSMSSFYTVSMPGKLPDGSLDLQDGYGYCDAKSGGNTNFCPEMDLMRA